MAPARAGWGRLLRGAALGHAFGVSAAASTLTLGANVLLLRALNVEDAGRYALLQTLVAGMGLLCWLGQPALTLRLYSRQPPGAYDWPRDLAAGGLVVAPSLVLGSLLALLAYGLPLTQTLYLLCAGLLGFGVSTISAMLASLRRHTWSNALIRLPGALMIAAALVVAAAPPGRATLWPLLGWHLAALAAMLIAGAAVLRHVAPGGLKHISLAHRRLGLTLLAAQASSVMLDYGLLAIAGALVSAEHVAAYAAVVTLFSPLQLLWSVLTSMLLAEMACADAPRQRAIIVGTLGLGLALGIGAVLVARPLLGLLYGGRYADGSVLIPWVALIYALKLVELGPRSLVVARYDDERLHRFALAQLALAALGAAVALLLVGSFGVVGAAWSGALLAALRLATSYWWARRSVS